MPPSEEANEEVALELAVQDLREEVQVAHKGGLQDDWDVAGVEELDGVRESLSTSALAVELKLDTEALRKRKKKLAWLNEQDSKGVVERSDFHEKIILVALRSRYAYVPANMNGKIFIIERVAVRNELHPAIAPVLEGLTYLEVNDDEDDKDSGHQVADVRRVLSIEGLLQGIELVRFCEQEVEKSDDSTLKLGTLLGTNSDRREALP